MRRRANYFLLGLFVIAAVAMAVGSIVALGAGVFAPEPFLVETYFDTSVTGLDAGAQVTFRGVNYGSVRSIAFARDEYDLAPGSKEWLEYGNYIVIVIAIDTSNFSNQAPDVIASRLGRLVSDGLRVQFNTKGLTGVGFLNGDFFEPKRYPPLHFPWQPRYYYVPSAPSTFASITESLDVLSKKLADLDLNLLITDVDEMLLTIAEAVDDLQIESFRADAGIVVADLKQATQRVSEVLGNEDLEAIIASARNTVELLESQLDNDDLSRTFENLNDATAELPTLARRLDTALRRLDNLFAGKSGELDQTLANIRSITENLRTVTDNLKRYPAHTLFGEPPPPSRHGGER